MRVLHLFSGNLYGGVETNLRTLARYRHFCPEMKPEFGFVFEGRLSRELKDEGVAVHALGRVRVRDPLSVWRARRRLRSLLTRNKFDIVICHMAWPQAIFAPIIRETGARLVSWQHGPLNERHWLERWASRTQPDLALCNSLFLAGSYASKNPNVRAEVLYCPVAPPLTPPSRLERSAVRRALATSQDRVVIIQVSRLAPWKGHRIHIEALAKLRGVSGWTCWIVGGPQWREEVAYLESLRRLSRSLGIEDRVRLLGERSDVEQLLKAADIFCQPNTSPEPFGIVFIEALYAGLPVVTSAMGGALEIVDRNCGELVPAGDSQAFAQALCGLILNPSQRAQESSIRMARARSYAIRKPRSNNSVRFWLAFEPACLSATAGATARR